jgi:hypothetical protein
MRQYGAIPAPNAAANTPAVSATTGLGTSGGASVQTPDSGNFGQINIQVGTNPSTGGSVTITFPDTPPDLFLAGSEGLGVITQETTVNDVAISWDGTPRANTKQTIHYEWSDYKDANP